MVNRNDLIQIISKLNENYLSLQKELDIIPIDSIDNIKKRKEIVKASSKYFIEIFEERIIQYTDCADSQLRDIAKEFRIFYQQIKKIPEDNKFNNYDVIFILPGSKTGDKNCLELYLDKLREN